MPSEPTVPLPPSVSVESKLAELDNVPLFMRSLPEEGSEAVEALQSLVHEGTPNEVAENFKDQGNSYFKGKRFREALGFYSQGVDAKPDDPVLREALLCNRAACNLELKNYGSVLRDCSAAISLNPRSSKAFYRSALSLKALGRLDESLDACQRYLAFDRDNAAVKKLLDVVSVAKHEKERKERERLEGSKRQQLETRLLAQALKDRNVYVTSSPQSDPDKYGFPHFDPSEPKPWTPLTPLIFPVFFLYPQHSTSDLISHFHEHTTVMSHLETIFAPDNSPPDWDPQREYTPESVVVIAVTRRKRLLKVGRKMTLADVVNAGGSTNDGKPDGVELKDGTIGLVVLLKGPVEQAWVDDFKRARDTLN